MGDPKATLTKEQEGEVGHVQIMCFFTFTVQAASLLFLLLMFGKEEATPEDGYKGCLIPPVCCHQRVKLERIVSHH